MRPGEPPSLPGPRCDHRVEPSPCLLDLVGRGCQGDPHWARRASGPHLSHMDQDHVLLRPTELPPFDGTFLVPEKPHSVAELDSAHARGGKPKISLGPQCPEHWIHRSQLGITADESDCID